MGRTKNAEGRSKLTRPSFQIDAEELRSIWSYASEEEERLGKRLSRRALAGLDGPRVGWNASIRPDGQSGISYWQVQEALARRELRVRHGMELPEEGYLELSSLFSELRPETGHLEGKEQVPADVALDEELAVHRRFASAVTERHFLMFCKRFGVPFEPTPDGGRSRLRWHSLEELERRCKGLFAYLDLWDSIRGGDSSRLLMRRLEAVREVDDGVPDTDDPREVLCDFVERMVALRCRPRLDLESKKLWFEPMDTLGAVYLNFAKEITGELRQPIVCSVCGDWFSPRDARQTVCSAYCKLKRTRAKARAKEASNG